MQFSILALYTSDSGENSIFQSIAGDVLVIKMSYITCQRIILPTPCMKVYKNAMNTQKGK
jgi:hypothetical protein